jgi:hypothetical protein
MKACSDQQLTKLKNSNYKYPIGKKKTPLGFDLLGGFEELLWKPLLRI